MLHLAVLIVMIYCLGSSVSDVHLKMHSVKLFLCKDVKNKWIGSRVGTFDSCLKTDQPSQRIRKSKFLRLGCCTGGCCFVGVCLTCSQMSLFFILKVQNIPVYLKLQAGLVPTCSLLVFWIWSAALQTRWSCWAPWTKAVPSQLTPSSQPLWQAELCGRIRFSFLGQHPSLLFGNRQVAKVVIPFAEL